MEGRVAGLGPLELKYNRLSCPRQYSEPIGTVALRKVVEEWRISAWAWVKGTR